MLDREFARAQIRRLAGLRFFPDEPEAVGELIDALRTAPTEDAAVDFIDDWRRHGRVTPLPIDIYEAFPAQTPPPCALCPVCGGTGWKIIERGGLSGAEECECRKRKLAAMTTQEAPKPKTARAQARLERSNIHDE